VPDVTITFYQGIPTIEEIRKRRPNLIVLDDLMDEVTKDIRHLFTKGSHHANVSGILISQNFYSKGKHSRDILLNIPYIVLMKNPRDQTIIRTIGSQIFSGKTKKFIEIYQDATSIPFSYLFLDFKPDTPNELRVLSNIFAEPPIKLIIVYKID